MIENIGLALNTKRSETKNRFELEDHEFMSERHLSMDNANEYACVLPQFPNLSGVTFFI